MIYEGKSLPLLYGADRIYTARISLPMMRSRQSDMQRPLFLAASDSRRCTREDWFTHLFAASMQMRMFPFSELRIPEWRDMRPNESKRKRERERENCRSYEMTRIRKVVGDPLTRRRTLELLWKEGSADWLTSLWSHHKGILKWNEHKRAARNSQINAIWGRKEGGSNREIYSQGRSSSNDRGGNIHSEKMPPTPPRYSRPVSMNGDVS